MNEKGNLLGSIKGTEAEGRAIFRNLIKGAKKTERGQGYVLKMVLK